MGLTMPIISGLVLTFEEIMSTSRTHEGKYKISGYLSRSFVGIFESKLKIVNNISLNG